MRDRLQYLASHTNRKGHPMIDLTAQNERWKTTPAIEIVREARDIFKTGLVAATHADSTSALMLHLTANIDIDIPVIHIEEDPKTTSFARELAEKYELNIHCFPLSDSKPKTMEYAVRKLGGEGLVGLVHGARGYQTSNREKKQILELGRDGIYRIYPVLLWSRDMVANYFNQHRLLRRPDKVFDYRDDQECGLLCYPHMGDSI